MVGYREGLKFSLGFVAHDQQDLSDFVRVPIVAGDGGGRYDACVQRLRDSRISRFFSRMLMSFSNAELYNQGKSPSMLHE